MWKINSDPGSKVLKIPQKVATAVRGILFSVSATINYFADQFFHITLTPDDVATFTADLGLAAGAIATTYGLLMKVVMRFGKKI